MEEKAPGSQRRDKGKKGAEKQKKTAIHPKLLQLKMNQRGLVPLRTISDVAPEWGDLVVSVILSKSSAYPKGNTNQESLRIDALGEIPKRRFIYLVFISFKPNVLKSVYIKNENMAVSCSKGVHKERQKWDLVHKRKGRDVESGGNGKNMPQFDAHVVK